MGAGALASGSLGNDRTRVPTGRRSSAIVGLPVPITIAAGRVLGRVSYRIGRDGRVTRIAEIRSPFPHDSAWFPGTDVWFSVRRGHLVVGRWKKRLWRSHGKFPQSERNARQQVGVVTIGSRSVAFSYDGKLFFAPLGGAERMVARGEFPLGFTSGGLYTYRYPGRELVLRSDTGALRKVIARPLGSDYAVAGGRLYFISRGEVLSASGNRTHRLGALHSLGVSNPSLESVGHLLELQDNNRLVFLRTDGSVFASTSLPRSAGAVENISGGPVITPRATAVAFAAAPGRTADGFGVENVYVLRAGAHQAVSVHGASVNLGRCERGANLQWHGDWLLYSNTEHDLVAIDTAGAHHAIELSHIVRMLPGARGGFSAFWSGQLGVV
jgi:hypothetical protein